MFDAVARTFEGDDVGVVDDPVGETVAAQLADAGRLAKARVHPVNVLVAQRTYASGQGRE